MIRFNKKAFAVFSFLFLIEVLIAKYVTQAFIRYWFGDFLVVIVIYYFLKSFLQIKPIQIALLVLVFSFTIEFLQLTKLLDVLQLRHHKIANLILGNTFSISDLIAYVLGILTILLIEVKR